MNLDKSRTKEKQLYRDAARLLRLKVPTLMKLSEQTK
jgi:hypothetical protein